MQVDRETGVLAVYLFPCLPIYTRAEQLPKKENYMLKVGEPVPSFTLLSDTAGEFSTQKMLGKRYVLFVYPKDDTFG